MLRSSSRMRKITHVPPPSPAARSVLAAAGRGTGGKGNHHPFSRVRRPDFGGGFLQRTVSLLFATLAACMLTASIPSAAGRADDESSPIFGVTIPQGYRHWELVAVSHEAGSLDELRGILGNAESIHAYREGKLPFPDGAVLIKLAWKHVPSDEYNKALGRPQAFVPGRATTVQIMVKDSKKYAATGGWGFGRFIDGKPVDEAQHKTCFACHEANVKQHDFVFYPIRALKARDPIRALKARPDTRRKSARAPEPAPERSIELRRFRNEYRQREAAVSYDVF